MPRVRLIHPDAPKDEDVASCSAFARLVWAYLPCHADREGRLPDKPFTLRLEILPTDNVDMNALLQELADRGLIIRYELQGRRFIQIRTFLKHQNPHTNEAPSELEPPDGYALPLRPQRRRRQPSDATPGPVSPADPVAMSQAADTLAPCHEDSLQGERARAVSDPDPVTDPVSDPASAQTDVRALDPYPGAPGVAIRSVGSVPAPVALGKPPPWRSGWEWRMQFGLAWRDKYSVTYGNGGDSRAVRELEDSVLASMPEEELRPLWERRREMFDAFLRASDPVLTQKKHPLSFFVTRFTDYRPDATALEQATEKPCTFHRGARNSGRGAPKADFRHECAECRHVAARAGPRPLAQPKGVAELIAELAAQQGG